MSTPEPTGAAPPRPSVFLSYASEDRPAAQMLRDTLPIYGLEVWYDESGLVGGDAWDQKIRRQIRECDFFMPLISAQTEARPEGYFRREWRLAVERTLDMADDHPYLLPIVIDDTTQAGARVPERFLLVQWTRAPGGRPTPALEALCRRLVSHEAGAAAPRSAADEPRTRRLPSSAQLFPPFPREAPGQKTRFSAHIVGWALQSAWVFFRRLPRWVRVLLYVWLAILIMARACTPSDRGSRRVSSDDAQRIKQIAAEYQGSRNKADIARLGAQIAKEFSDQVAPAEAHSALLAIPFSAPAGDAAAQKLADAAFAQTYGRVALALHGDLNLTDEAISPLEASEAAARGRAQHAKYVLCGGIDPQSTPPTLAVRLVQAADGSTLWSRTYPLAGTDPGSIAADVDAKVRALDID